MLADLAQKFGLNLPPEQLNSGSIALVMLSAKLPAFAHVGMTIDVQVTALTQVDSLQGGVLQRADLVWFDGDNSPVFAIASGPVTTGGFGYSASTSRVARNNPASGKVSRGATVVKPIEPKLLSEAGDVELILVQPSLRTATNIARAIDAALAGTGVHAEVHDRAMVRIGLPTAQQNRRGALDALRLVGDLRVEVEHPSRVVIDADTGTLVVGADVRISPCVVMTSDVTVTIVDQDEIVQPLPFSRGQTAAVRRSQTGIEIQDTPPAAVRHGATVAELVENLRALNLTTRQMIDVFQSLDRRFLHAELEIR